MFMKQESCIGFCKDFTRVSEAFDQGSYGRIVVSGFGVEYVSSC